MPKTTGGVVGVGLKDSLIVKYEINRTVSGEGKTFGGTTETHMTPEMSGLPKTIASAEAFTLPGSYHLEKVVAVGRNVVSSAAATGTVIRVNKAEAATPLTFADIVDNSVDGAAVVDYFRIPHSSTTIALPFATTYKGIPQVGTGTGAGWTGATADDFVAGDRCKITIDTIDGTSEVNRCYVYAIFSSLD